MSAGLPIPGFPGYLISRDGVVTGMRGHEIKPRTDRDGYVFFGMVRDGKQRHMRRGRLLLMTFVRMPEGNEECDHINRNAGDDRLENLRWLTPLANKMRKVGKCVRYREQLKKWQAYCVVGRVFRSLGHFATYEEAKAVRMAWIAENKANA